jgi:hypothetical protein
MKVGFGSTQNILFISLITRGTVHRPKYKMYRPGILPVLRGRKSSSLKVNGLWILGKKVWSVLLESKKEKVKLIREKS